MKTSLLFMMIMLVFAAEIASGQSCYKRTSDFAWANYFAKAMTDSTCFGEWNDTLYYYNVKTGTSMFQLCINDYHPADHTPYPVVTDVLMHDSLLIINWPYYLRVLKINDQGKAVELPTDLDSMPVIKNHGAIILKETTGQRFIVRHGIMLYSFIHTNWSVECTDSVQLPKGHSGPFDVSGDTIVLAPGSDTVYVYLVNATGALTYVGHRFLGRESIHDAVYFHSGNLFLVTMNYRIQAFVPAGGQYSYARSFESEIFTGFLKGPKTISLVSDLGAITVMDQELNFICRMPSTIPFAAFSASMTGAKIFISSTDGVHTYVPEETTSSIEDGRSVSSHDIISVFPNPLVGKYLHICTIQAAVAVTIHDGNGRVVCRKTDCEAGWVRFDLGGCPKGSYFIKAESMGGICTKRVQIL